MIPFLDIKAQYEAIRSELDAAVLYGIGDFPVSERLANETLSLPIFPEMTSQQVETVCGAVINALQPSSPARLPARPLIDSLTNGS
jgi:dTDP-4-amino-4,6-dideoxygalactose transaminase